MFSRAAFAETQSDAEFNLAVDYMKDVSVSRQRSHTFELYQCSSVAGIAAVWSRLEGMEAKGLELPTELNSRHVRDCNMQ
jgi:hypothetical protein